MAEIAFAIVGKIGEYLVAPIGRQFGYLFCYNNNIENLRDQANKLKDIKDGVQLSASAARNNLEVIAPHVESWLIEVENIMKESDRIFKYKALVDKGCLSGWCPNLRSHYSLSRKASKQAQVIVDLRRDGEPFTKFSYPAPPTGMAESSSTGGSKGLQSRMLIVKEIIDALNYDNITVIGICGMGGVGKTTLVKEIAERAKSEKKIDEFAMAVVSHNIDVIKIQSQLAEMLGLELKEQTNNFARAQRLRERLANGNRVLVILDDVWGSLNMKEIGIPIGNERKGCKVALTSRIIDVCSQMGTQKNFTIEVLSEQEAWGLFKEMAGNCVDADDVCHIAGEVAKECGGLPLALITVAKALKNKKKHTWDDALRQLRKSTVTNIKGMHELVYSRIELSYNYLKSRQAKSLLLLCCLFREDEEIPIEVLVRYGVGLELFEDLDTLVETRKRVDSLVNELRSSYLLLVEDGSAFVKMHDVIRDACLFIASKDEHEYMVRHDTSMEEWPKKDYRLPYTTITLYSAEMQELPASLDCPNLKLLQFVGAPRKKLEIPVDVFKGVKELRVVTFSSVRIIESQPTSLKFLLNLRTLCLENCKFLGDLSFIGGLHKLEILSFFDSKGVVLPSEAKELSNLKLLDLRCTSFYTQRWCTRIPFGVLSCLRKLEELYMGIQFFKDDDQETRASVTLNSLSCLKRLEILIPSGNKVLSMLKDYQFSNLIEFDFSVLYDTYIYVPKYKFRENRLSLGNVDRTVLLENNINALFRRTKELELRKVRELKNVVKDLDEEEGFVQLETLRIEYCDEVEYVYMDDDDAEIICRRLGNPIQRPSPLVNLRILEVFDCHAMKCMFKSSTVKCLVQLQKLMIYNCNELEGIVLAEGRREESKETRDKIVLPKLNFLELAYLPKFRSFFVHSTGEKEDNNLGSENIDDIHTTQLLFNPQVLLPNLEKLLLRKMEKHVLLEINEMQDESLYNIKDIIVSDCNDMESILLEINEMQDESLYNIKDIIVSDCNDMESIFDFKRLKTGRKELAKVVLGQLESMDLSYMDKLTHIWRMVPRRIQGFRNLRILEVQSCPKLRYLLSPLVAKMVVNLQYLKLKDCWVIEQVIRTEEEEEINMIDKIVFPQLRVLSLEKLENLRMFCIREHDFELPLLEEVFIAKCPNMKAFCSGQLIMPKLERVWIDVAEVYNDQSWYKGDLNSTLAYVGTRYEDPQDSLE
ncbi:hypothetical protein LguiB_005466 [Lonicera macranthoides]